MSDELKQEATDGDAISDLLQKLADEVDKETVASLSKEEQALEAVAREILKLERDLTLPGTGQSESTRVERLLQFIAGKDF